MRCATCGRRLPTTTTRRFCSRRCQAPVRQIALDRDAVLAALNSGRAWEWVAHDFTVSRITLYRYCQRTGIVRIAGSAHHPGRYAVERPNHQLAWF